MDRFWGSRFARHFVYRLGARGRNSFSFTFDNFPGRKGLLRKGWELVVRCSEAIEQHVISSTAYKQMGMTSTGGTVSIAAKTTKVQAGVSSCPPPQEPQKYHTVVESVYISCVLNIHTPASATFWLPSYTGDTTLSLALVPPATLDSS